MDCNRLSFLILLAGAVLGAGTEALAEKSAPQFDRDIRPILAKNCFSCHGPDAKDRKADLRLDTREGALADHDGRRAIEPGQPGRSELVRRITTDDQDDVMPRSKTGKKLAPEQIELIQRWIAAGAAYQTHWSFVPPTRPVSPTVQDPDWISNPIDRFILARLEKEGIQPAPRASREVLIRRATLSLTGLPPALAEVDAFLADGGEGAYDRLIDRLLESPHYGEHMARFWLDAARYGDTHGLHLDNERSIWPYRDWVVRAFNDNLPFDRFTIEQIAGDLLPDPTQDQLVATGFNRCNVTTSEGGAIPKEFAVRYAVDRTSTLGTVWMGLTVGCAQCHDHKFDPLTQKDFYRLLAFYNSLDENPLDGNALLPPPSLRLATPEQKAVIAEDDARIRLVRKAIRLNLAAFEDPKPSGARTWERTARKEYVWIDDVLPEGINPPEGGEGLTFVSGNADPVFSGERAIKSTATGAARHDFRGAKHPLLVGAGDTLFAYVYLDPNDPPQSIMLQFHAANWDHRAYWGRDKIPFGRGEGSGHRRIGDLPRAGKWVRLALQAKDVGLGPGTEVDGWACAQFGGTVYWDKSGILSKAPQGAKGFESWTLWEGFLQEGPDAKIPKEIRAAIRTARDKRTGAQRQRIRDYFIENIYPPARAVFAPLHVQLKRLRARRDAFDHSIPRTMITRELPKPRDTFVLARGRYDKPTTKVQPGVPGFLPPLPDHAPGNRLGLARWLVSPQNPLTARVIVNRLWQQHFGVGIVKTAEDFGSQGAPPSHPALLDWLACELMDSGWDIKHMQRLIVTSSTFQQSSGAPEDWIERDPENRLLARGPRYRMDAEMIRDGALAISGLLVGHLGGHGVKPYQPSGLWQAVGYPTSNTSKFRQDTGESLYRRSLYTFLKRTSPAPVMTTFDAPSREACTVRRERTNTPLQALTLMNEEGFVEAARHVAGRVLSEGGNTVGSRIRYAFRLATARWPDAEEIAILKDVYASHLDTYLQSPEAAEKLIHAGDSQTPKRWKPARLAAWTMVANLILNLDETITIH